MGVVGADDGVGDCQMTPLLVGLMVEGLLAIAVGLVQIVFVLSALSALLLPLVRSIAPRPPPLVSWIHLLELF